VPADDVLQLFERTRPAAWLTGETPRRETVITINGRELVEIIRTAELPFALAEGHPDLAGAYAGLPPELAFLPSMHLLGDPDDLYSGLVRTGEDTKPAVLVCECGEPGCWPLCVRIDVEPGVVVWTDFEQPHRARDDGRNAAWSHAAVGPFRFDRAAYEAALGTR
jgi:hypothetical protein